MSKCDKCVCGNCEKWAADCGYGCCDICCYSHPSLRWQTSQYSSVCRNKRIKEARAAAFTENQIITGDALAILKTLPDECVNTCVTSPPYYGLRNYGNDAQMGLEETPELYIQKLVNVFAEVKRVLRKDGTLWVNIADSYAGSGKGWSTCGIGDQTKRQGFKSGKPFKDALRKSKDLLGIPWMLAFALRDKLGLYLRDDIIWAKPNPMPESVGDRCTRSHEYIFLFSKSSRYHFDGGAIMEDCVSCNTQKPAGSRGTDRMNARHREAAEGATPTAYELRHKRDVWTVAVKPYKGAHFATFPVDLIEPCILAGCPNGGVVLDPFCGSGTVVVAAIKNNRKYIGIDLNPQYVEIAENRIAEAADKAKECKLEAIKQHEAKHPFTRVVSNPDKEETI